MKFFYYPSFSVWFLQILIFFHLGSHHAYANLNSPFGCYQVDESLSEKGTHKWLTPQYCYDNICKDDPDISFVAVRGVSCYCGNTLTAKKVDSSNCNTVCPGWDEFKCGGDLYWSVYLTGNGILHTSSSTTSSQTSSSKASSSSSFTTASSSSSNPTSSSKPTSSSQHLTSSSHSASKISSSSSNSPTPTTFSSSLVKTVTPSASSSSSSPSPSPSSTAPPKNSQASKSSNSLNAGAIVGIVIGCVAFAVVIALCVCLFFWYRKFKAKMNAKDDITFPSYKSELDSRLDPGMLNNRNSSESLADSQDYSRRILRVMN
ncbi:transmembrane receptor Wsc1 [Schizosaccharomyces cryophilus OY26]|uniref:Transmembrane receptor Wsc1 n=1 Tax=Schizosaccharomyces cryophilus (strain OY26 / ATCC MYA-4695 / CBS 11777 / NBRC 106824 / NRRL Y48691) TaxID=653667 RepID=S9VT41_SCHCR|nr:transmembrane receptor Wsc1 [Schizosaccharomyces cryophilus OY26]EPY49300.1 transmembrane receptor Wsc1 [Schizosaccharomyces cryophilus OY26]